MASLIKWTWVWANSGRYREGQGSLACCSSWGHKEWDLTGLLNNNLYSLGFSTHMVTWSSNRNNYTSSFQIYTHLGICLCLITLARTSSTILNSAKSLQSCPTLCDPIDGSPPGSHVPGIFQARTLEWVAISFSSALKWKVKAKSLSPVWLLVTSWTAAHQALLSMGFSRQEYWSGVPLPSPSNSSKCTQLVNMACMTPDYTFDCTFCTPWRQADDTSRERQGKERPSSLLTVSAGLKGLT